MQAREKRQEDENTAKKILHSAQEERPSEQIRLTQTLRDKLGLHQLVGKSPNFRVIWERIPVIAKTEAKVLISGETGTGKEICARAVHYLSSRAPKAFVPVNCGAIPENLVENELFGHVRGAFTGASTTQHGLISEAQGGTLFLDEIDSLPSMAQVKLLRFLQEGQYRPLGSTRTLHANVRIIAASNIDLEKAMQAGEFRQDLYYRLNIIPITLPPLRERQEDIPLLARYFLKKYSTEFDRPAQDFSADALQILMLYEWPGNVRELEHIVERTVVLCEHKVIHPADLPLPALGLVAGTESLQEAKAKVVARFERTYIQNLLRAHRGNISKAARAAQKNRRAFWQLMHKYGITADGFKLGILFTWIVRSLE